MMALYRLGYPLFWCTLWALAPFSQKIRKGLWERRGLIHRLKKVSSSWNPSLPRLWFHVSSAGELEQALPILDRLKTQSPQMLLILTYFSPSAKNGLLKEISRRAAAGIPCSWDFADYSPFDFPWSVRRFLKALHPSKLFLVHRELWPEMLFQAGQHGIPAFGIATYVPKKGPLTIWERFVFSFLKGICTVDSHSLTVLKPLFPQSCLAALGDPRVERVLDRKERFSSSLPIQSFFTNRHVFVGASLWEEDFTVLLTTLSQIQNTFPKVCFVVVPHEPTEKRINRWQERLKEHGIPTRRWSAWVRSPDMDSHLIVDEVGLLAELYALSESVFVGGSFKKRIHNVLEPLAYGAHLFSGPYYKNSLEAQELVMLNLLTVVSSPPELQVALEKVLKGEFSGDAHAKTIHSFFETRKGVSQQYVSFALKDLVNIESKSDPLPILN